MCSAPWGRENGIRYFKQSLFPIKELKSKYGYKEIFEEAIMSFTTGKIWRVSETKTRNWFSYDSFKPSTNINHKGNKLGNSFGVEQRID